METKEIFWRSQLILNPLRPSHYRVANEVSLDAGELKHLYYRPTELTVRSEFKFQELVSKLSLVPNIISQIEVTC